MAAVASELRSFRVVPEGVTTETFNLSPTDVFDTISTFPLGWPVFFNYDIDGDRFVEALKTFLVKYPILCGRIQPHEDFRYVIEVDAENDDKHGVSFSEWKTDLSVAAVILNHSKLATKTVQGPTMPEIPFYMEVQDYATVISGGEPILKARLTHCADGCILNVCIHHTLLDGQRYIEALRDIGRAYRGKDVPDRDHSRNYLWPDQIAKHFNLGDEVANMPRKLPAANNDQWTNLPEESCLNCPLFFSNDLLQKMKSRVKPFLTDGDYVSTNDVLVAFCWLLGSELRLKAEGIAKGADLDIDNTFMFVIFEALKNGIKVIPENYSGNAIMNALAFSQGSELNEKPLGEVFAKLALLMRKTVNSIREQPPLAAQQLLFHYVAMTSGQSASSHPLMPRMRGLLTNLLKTPIDEIDFGKGKPVFTLLLIIPYYTHFWTIGPGFGFDGMVVQGSLSATEAAALKDSVIVKEFAPEVRNVHSDFSVDELKKRMNLAA